AGTTPTERIAALTAVAEGGLGQGAIVAALDDPSAAVRDWAIRLATRYVEPAVLGGLVADDDNATLRNAALVALERQGPYAVPHLQAMLAEPNPEVVMFAVQVLSRIGDRAAVDAILPLVAHADPNVAQSAVEALGRLRHTEAAPALIALLEGNLWLQLAAVEALGEIASADAVDPLLALVPDSFVAEAALRALQKIAAPESLAPLLERLLDDRERALRDAVLEAVGVAIDLHPDPEAIARRFGTELRRREETRSLLTYLADILRAPDGERAEALVRAAGVLTVAAALTPLLPFLLRRATRADELLWVEPVFRRYGRGLTDDLRPLLPSDQPGDLDPAVRAGALLVGTFSAADLPLIIDHLRDNEPQVRAAACVALGVLRAAETVPLLVDHLAGGTPVEQAAAAGALARMPGDALVDLEPCLAADVSEAVQLLALQVVTKSKHVRFEPRVVKLCRSRSPVVRLAAVRAAARLPGPRTEVVLVRGIADADEHVRVEALASLVERGGSTAVATLVAMLSAGDSLRYHVIRALGQLAAPSALAKLVAMYDDCTPFERLEIVAAVGRIGGPAAMPFLTRCLAGHEGDVRRTAARGIATIADAEVAPLLLALSRDPDWVLRAEAARGLGRLALPGTRETLLLLVRDIEPAVASVARASLNGDRAGTAPAAA
ncbi:MAG: HEAT repeat domain-containing protein, partial [Gemmatimonadales bacterium]|nr:HEAT repeat domain-containing protein [Gemmatimonadales bacterium]